MKMKNGLKIDRYGNKKWYKEEKYHRKNGPAVEYISGTKEWYKEGKRHRDDGPAIEYISGDKLWFKDNRLHREDGPAVDYSNGPKSWYYKGKWIDCTSTKEFIKLLKLKAFW